MALEDDFKNTLSCWASGVSVVATRSEGLCYALTVSSFSSLSLTPPLVLVCLHRNNRMGSLLDASKGFGISILARDQEPVSNLFASRGREPAPSLEGCVDSATGQPLVEGAAAWLDCALHAVYDGGDHTIVVGRVLSCGAEPAREPLLYHQRAYRSLTVD